MWRGQRGETNRSQEIKYLTVLLGTLIVAYERALLVFVHTATSSICYAFGGRGTSNHSFHCFGKFNHFGSFTPPPFTSQNELNCWGFLQAHRTIQQIGWGERVNQPFIFSMEQLS